MRLRFIFLTGPESAPVTYTPKSGPRALGDPQPGGGGGSSCASSGLTRAPHQPNSEVGGREFTLCPKAPPLLPGSERLPAPPQPGVPASLPTFPRGPRSCALSGPSKEPGIDSCRAQTQTVRILQGPAATIARPPPNNPARRRPGGNLVSCPQPTSARQPAPSARNMPSRGRPALPGPLPPLSAPSDCRCTLTFSRTWWGGWGAGRALCGGNQAPAAAVASKSNTSRSAEETRRRRQIAQRGTRAPARPPPAAAAAGP
ncbi:vegetative cell wall protein gp1-like [Cervus elaphus]|uniref:vegetative cell wall protein gp1-like n=1 Tax=Cervus elaphus TaxID=9860 RepID=UPI001CC2BCA8|nr:vegetative cell wall protein gp1-like [Cervus elaphus]